MLIVAGIVSLFAFTTALQFRVSTANVSGLCSFLASSLTGGVNIMCARCCFYREAGKSHWIPYFSMLRWPLSVQYICEGNKIQRMIDAVLDFSHIFGLHERRTTLYLYAAQTR